ncbi:alpha-1-antitrypsin homolog isoform X2 [Hoplias malabaricus]|uniref:alpha-1-antitrypsin homolog isoform X2 n=1 Tax=Hoplias malabaricus TaxID=27720 RepID=UPI0034634363
MWVNIFFLVVLQLMVVSADDHKHDEPSDHDKHLHHGKDEPHPSHEGGDDLCHKLSPHNADFAFSLYKKLTADPKSKGKNIIISPLSISMALSMMALGAKGDTHSQIFSSLGYSNLTSDQVNEGFEHLLHMLGHSQEAMQLEAGSALAIREGFKFLDKFLKDTQHFYQGEAFTVDYSNPDVAVQEVNKYIAKKTKDMITDMVKTLDQDTVMLLINYIYFRGKWEKPFDVEDTRKADFHVDKDTVVRVDMMMKREDYDSFYDRDNDTWVIMLPYKGNTSMMIVLPKEGNMEEVEKHICKDHLQKWHSEMYRSETLKEMGIVSAFSDTADFSGISEETKLKASKVLHQAVLKVDERGTDAAATTTIEFMPISLPPSVELNRPFLVFIVEDSTKSILFMGKINNPTL